ncbi:cobyric acid synthase [Conexibacter sp. DBS9H8]|uniref:cobyric acid synthase n=1 Tax=Conexibacter sp. DBS9H8 TaxID=2937801 RepID=UPI00200D54DC|nr:cobyric acid synthase [Conexibacter sp. DBS9H8]
MKGALLVAGATSDAGKSFLVTGLCRWLAREGVSVAPFKGQNMALNSVVTRSGAEVGRAQAVQAAAAGAELEAAMNPVLIKPTGDRHSQVIVMGTPYAEVDARSYRDLTGELRPIVADALADLRRRYDVVICEGAGSPAEINLRASDITNMWLARTANLATVVVADIDRGGSLAALFGTLALLDPADQAHVSGFIINKFRGDAGLLAPGLETLRVRTGRPTLGVLPFLEGPAIDAEDSLALHQTRPEAPPRPGGETLDVVVLALARISNFTDVDALATEPGVRVRFSSSPADVERADLVILPGTKATVADLGRLRAGGLDAALSARAAADRPILGICGGYQMLGELIDDPVESRAGAVPGLGLLPVRTLFVPDKLLENRTGHCPSLDAPVSGYEIRHGRLDRHGGEPFITPDEGCVAGAVLGTSWHGALEGDAFRAALLGWVADRVGRRFVPGSEPFSTVRAQRLDALADHVGAHLDLTALAALIQHGPTRHPEVRVAALHHDR